MQTTLRIETTVLPGNRIEFTAPELAEGEKVEVTVTVVPHADSERRMSMIEFLRTLPPGPRSGSAHEFLQSLPAGPRAFDTWEEYEAFLRKEKDSWD